MDARRHPRLRRKCIHIVTEYLSLVPCFSGNETLGPSCRESVGVAPRYSYTTIVIHLATQSDARRVAPWRSQQPKRIERVLARHCRNLTILHLTFLQEWFFHLTPNIIYYIIFEVIIYFFDCLKTASCKNVRCKIVRQNLVICSLIRTLTFGRR